MKVQIRGTAEAVRTILYYASHLVGKYLISKGNFFFLVKPRPSNLTYGLFLCSAKVISFSLLSHVPQISQMVFFIVEYDESSILTRAHSNDQIVPKSFPLVLLEEPENIRSPARIAQRTCS